MAKGKGWHKDPPKDQETADTPPELTLAGELEKKDIVPVEDSTVGDVPVLSKEDISRAEVRGAEMLSCMNGCPHFHSVPAAGGKFLGYCRRYPPTSIARFHYQFAIINHPTENDGPPICGEHPSFRKFA